MKLLFSLLILLCAFTTHAQFMSAHRLATLQAQAIVGINADTFMDFHAQTIGAAYNTNLVQSDVWGNPTGWAVTLATAPHTYTNVIVPNFNFSTPIQTPDGHIASGTGTNGLLQDLSEGATGIMQQDFTGFSAHVSSVTFWLMFTNISAPNTSSYDLYNLFENPYSIAEFKSDNSDYGPYGSQIRAYIHTEIAPASYTSGLGTNLWMKGELLQDYYSGLSYLSLFNATNNALLYSSVAYGTPSVTDVQDLLRVTAGYIHIAPDSGYIYRTPFYLQLDSHVPTNRPPWVPNAPSSVLANQYAVASNMVVSMTDNNFMLNSNLLHYSNSIDGDAVQWIQPQQTSCIVGGLTPGHTYDTRIESYFINGVKSAASAGPSVTISTPVLAQNFEGTGTPPSFSTAGGSPNYHNTSSPLTGSKDCLLGGGTDDDVAIDIGSMSEVWMVTEFLTPQYPNVGQGIIYIEPSGHQVVVKVISDGTLIIQQDASTVGSATASGIPLNTKIWIKFHAKKGTGANAIYDIEWSTDGSFAGSGSKFTSYSSGTLTGNFTTAELYCATSQWPGGTLMHFDDVGFFSANFP
jgi:hypothetical protein